MNKEFTRIRDDRPSPGRQPTGSWNGLGTNPLRRVFYCLRFLLAANLPDANSFLTPKYCIRATNPT
ncbi:hypothetical protein KPSA1_07181 [Pseudomonas syringae pv. actinidiae]|uniref:Uncharacterized protein n=1 Tax=Pseudomonas syringae pv. actinidiae TaxID=103796 RepID=A0A2V0QL72_PSESF|nr:hypothetical protein KPSA1_07181 [Pseudomonas syringae pv. actinidiae]